MGEWRCTFPIICEGNVSSVSELVLKGRLEKKFNYVDVLLTLEKEFSLQKHKPASRMIDLVGFEANNDPKTWKYLGIHSESVLDEFKLRGIGRPTYEDAFYFALQFPPERFEKEICEQERRSIIVFLHEHENVIVLSLNSWWGYDIQLFSFNNPWWRNAVFATICK
jgi:hypothetical protein